MIRDIAVLPTVPRETQRFDMAATLDARAVRAVCGACDRRLFCTGVRGERPRILFQIRPILDDADFCRWCARAISERGRQRTDNAGFLNVARMILGERAPAQPTSPEAA